MGTSDDGLLCIAYQSGVNSNSTVNEAIVSAGLGFVPKEKKKRRWNNQNNSKHISLTPSEELTNLMDKLSVCEEKAKRSRVEIWRFGDIAEEDDEDA